MAAYSRSAPATLLAGFVVLLVHGSVSISSHGGFCGVEPHPSTIAQRWPQNCGAGGSREEASARRSDRADRPDPADGACANAGTANAGSAKADAANADARRRTDADRSRP